jgi:hypothetical protein
LKSSTPSWDSPCRQKTPGDLTGGTDHLLYLRTLRTLAIKTSVPVAIKRRPMA